MCFWYKKLNRYRDLLAKQCNLIPHQSEPLAYLLSIVHAILSPQKTDIYIPKTYRPITCLNILCKL